MAKVARDQRVAELVRQQADRDADCPNNGVHPVAARKHQQKQEVKRAGRDRNAGDGEQMERTHTPRITQAAWFCLALLLWAAATPSHASAFELGGHLGVGLDHGSIHLGGDGYFPIADVSPSVRLAIWPSAAFVINDGPDGVLICADFPFEFEIANSIVSPFVGPGFGVGIFNDDATVKLNIVGGVFIDTGTVRPFAELALRFIDGTFVDLLVGVLVEL
jgi:hypothetical protein